MGARWRGDTDTNESKRNAPRPGGVTGDRTVMTRCDGIEQAGTKRTKPMTATVRSGAGVARGMVAGRPEGGCIEGTPVETDVATHSGANPQRDAALPAA